ncbi:hypothetical protein ONZ45_g15540 [Pleurotus djamor]|nr:hypothetical protein ONZ45_g15540 [Pleurotus djamor]
MPYANQGGASTRIETFNDVAGDQVNNYKYNYINPQLQDAKEQLRPFAATDAAHDSSARYPADRCYTGTRLSLLKDIESWIKEEKPGQQIFWLHGAPLLGKSAVSQTVAERCQDLGRLGASVFFSNGDANRDKLRSLFLTIAYQLCWNSKARSSAIGKVIQKDPNLVHRSPPQQLRALLLKPFSNRSWEKNVIVIDAVDEAIADSGHIQLYLDLIRQATLDTPFRFFITSRMFPQLREFATTNTQNINLAFFYNARLAELRASFKEGPNWATSAEIQTLTSNADGLFIYPVVILKNDLACTRGIWSRLDGLYEKILSQIPEDLDDYYEVYVRRTISTLCLLYYPLRLADLKAILNFEVDVWDVLQDLHAFFHIPPKTESDTCVHLVHRYFRSWICDPKRSGKYSVDTKEGHADLADMCLKQMISGLSANMFHLTEGETVAKIPVEDKRAKFVSRVLEYSCRCWFYHLYDGLADGDALPPLVEKFSRYPILHWVELMGLLRRMEEVVTVLTKLSKLNQILATAVHERVVAILDFIDKNLDRIVPSPACIYEILGFSPLLESTEPSPDPAPIPDNIQSNDIDSVVKQVPDSTINPTTIASNSKDGPPSGSAPSSRADSTIPPVSLLVEPPPVPLMVTGTPSSPSPSPPAPAAIILPQPEDVVHIAPSNAEEDNSHARDTVPVNNVTIARDVIAPDFSVIPPQNIAETSTSIQNSTQPAPSQLWRIYAVNTTSITYVFNTMLVQLVSPSGDKIDSPRYGLETAPREVFSDSGDAVVSHRSDSSTQQPPTQQPPPATVANPEPAAESTNTSAVESVVQKWASSWNCSICEHIAGDLVIYSISEEEPVIICEDCLTDDPSLREQTFILFIWPTREQLGTRKKQSKRGSPCIFIRCIVPVAAPPRGLYSQVPIEEFYVASQSDNDDDSTLGELESDPSEDDIHEIQGSDINRSENPSNQSVASSSATAASSPPRASPSPKPSSQPHQKKSSRISRFFRFR